MLYATTRSAHDIHTAQRAVQADRTADGALYIPMKLLPFTKERIAALRGESEAGIIAMVLNLFFNTRLTYEDITRALGKQFVRVSGIRQRITVGECWHNAQGDMTGIEQALSELLKVEKTDSPASSWVKVAVHTAMLFAFYGKMRRENLFPPSGDFDVAVTAGDFCAPMGAWYARKLGLPVGTILCCCEEGDATWDLLRLGQMKLRRGQATSDGLERMICETLGCREAAGYASACNEGRTYEITEQQRLLLCNGVQIFAVGGERIPRVIANSYVTNGYVFSTQTAALYGALMDHRASAQSNTPAVLLSEVSPMKCAPDVCEAMGISPEQLRQRLQLNGG